MAVAARVHTARVAAARRGAAVRRASAAARTIAARRPAARSRFPKAIVALCCALSLAFALLYVSVYGTLATTSHSLSELQRALRREQILNERLTIDLERKLSPQGVVGAAQASGLVYATEYDYLRDSRDMARVPAGR